MSVQSFRLTVIMSLLSLVFGKCKPEKELTTEQQELQKIQKSSEEFAARSTEYRTFSPQISFFDPITEKDNPQLAIQKRKEFIKQSGLPDENSIGEFKKTKSLDFAFQLYTGHISRNSTSAYLKTFEQYGAWLILTRLDLLAQTSANDLQIINELVKRLISTNYQGFQLLSYSVNHLYLNKFDKGEIKSLCTSIIAYSNNVSIQDNNEQSTGQKNQQKPLRPEIVETLRKYNENRESTRQIALNQIQQLLAKL